MSNTASNQTKNDNWWEELAQKEHALEHGLKENEFLELQDRLGRPLNLLEVGICSALYSEHCSYKSTKVHLRNLPTEGKAVLQGPGENAGVIDIGDNQAVVFKVESHNHPSFIEPFQGAATGVGGILRDVFTMGARPLALMNSLRFGAAENSKTRHLLNGAVAGIGTYGNCMGIPTVGGELYFHEAYNGNCLVNAFALGLVQHDQIFLGAAAGIGNSILYIGSKTGRDGIHGATMASDVFDESSEEKRPTVQVGDPFQEKLLLEACLEAMASGAVVGIQDMGAAGLTSSAYEMAERGKTGVRLDLDLVPQRETEMNPYELMLSESQERMLVIVEQGKEELIQEIVNRWDLDAVKIGQVVEGNDVELYWYGRCVSRMPVSVVTSGVPQYRWPEKQPIDYAERSSFDASSITPPEDLNDFCLKLLADINVCSRAPVYSQYDSTVRSNTIVHPGGDAAVIRVKPDSAYNMGDSRYKNNQNSLDVSTGKGIAMTLDCNSRYCKVDPRQGAALSIAEAYRNISAVGARAIGISDCLNFGSPEKPEGMWEIAEGIRGLAESARAFEVPIVSGNVSLYNETIDSGILPTPLVAMVGLLDDASKAVSSYFKSKGDVVFLVGKTDESEIGSSQYMSIHAGVERGALPILNYDLEKRTAKLIQDLADRKLLKSCHDLSDGGLLVAAAECCFAPQGVLGLDLAVEATVKRPDAFLFSETGARYLISCSPEQEAEVARMIKEANLTVGCKGIVGGQRVKIGELVDLDLSQAYQSWKDGLKVFIQ